MMWAPIWRTVFPVLQCPGVWVPCPGSSCLSHATDTETCDSAFWDSDTKFALSVTMLKSDPHPVKWLRTWLLEVGDPGSRPTRFLCKITVSLWGTITMGLSFLVNTMKKTRVT